MTRVRDTYIDFARGLLMLSVIHIHTLYWTLNKVTPEIVRHLAYLVDIPIFFFISGYLFKNTSFLLSIRTAWRQFLRLYLHYVAITFLLAGGILLWLHFGEGRMEPQVGTVLASIFRVELTGRMWGYLRMYNGNLWYIRVYFSLLLLAPLLIGTPLFRGMKSFFLAFTAVCYALAVYHYDNPPFLLTHAGQAFFYAVFFILGAMYRTGEQAFRSKTALYSLALNLVLAGLVFYFDDNSLLLGRYKNPPTFQYLVYTLLPVHVFILARPYWARVKTRAVAPLVWAGRHSYELYLIQGAVCSLPILFVERVETANPWLLYALVFSFNVIGSFALSGLYVGACAAVSGVVRVARGEKRR